MSSRDLNFSKQHCVQTAIFLERYIFNGNYKVHLVAESLKSYSSLITPLILFRKVPDQFRYESVKVCYLYPRIKFIEKNMSLL